MACAIHRAAHGANWASCSGVNVYFFARAISVSHRADGFRTKLTLSNDFPRPTSDRVQEHITLTRLDGLRRI
ncbi:MAG: hypothetical protein RLZZ373_1200, partial [Pseudomonadota bacterium]